MAFTENSLAPQSIDLGKAVLGLSALGIFSKLLNVDIGSLQILGLTLSKAIASLLPGFLGLLLIYVYVAFCVARIEAGLHHATDKDAKKTHNDILKNKGLLVLAVISSPFAFFVYSMPYVLGGFSIYLLWSDSLSVIKAIWILI